MRVITPGPHHVFDFVDLVKEFLNEGIAGYDWGINEDDLHTTYHTWNKDYRWMLEDQGCIVGILAGIVAPHFFNYKNLVFSESMWYVKPAYRDKGGGLILYKRCVEVCKAKKITRLCFGHTRQMIFEFEQLYESLGFTYLETHYEKVL